MRCPVIVKTALFGLGNKDHKGWIKTTIKGENYIFKNTDASHKLMQRSDIGMSEIIKLMLNQSLLKKV